jgi:Methyltransferase domain
MPVYNQLELTKEYDSHPTKQQLLDDLRTIIIQSKDQLEGNTFYVHNSLNLYPELYTKQLNIFWSGKQATHRICEIGFNAGHSTLLLLLGRDSTPLNFTIFDINYHTYTRPSFEYIKTKFPHIAFELIEGDSTSTMPKWIQSNQSLVGTYDVVHVDGGHSEHCITNDMKHTDMLVKVNGIVIVDDTNSPTINDCVNRYLARGNYIELDVIKTYGYPHRIIQKIK